MIGSMDTETLKSFFLYGFLINYAFMLVAMVFIFGMRDWAYGIHSKLFKIDQAELPKFYFRYLAYQKLITISFFLVPYLALLLI